MHIDLIDSAKTLGVQLTNRCSRLHDSKLQPKLRHETYVMPIEYCCADEEIMVDTLYRCADIILMPKVKQKKR